MSAADTVFVVDDDEAVRDSLGALLESGGYRVRSFPTANAFLERYDSSPGCLVVDVRMPGMSGLELQALLATRGVALPLVVMTGHGDIPMAVAAMKAGAVDFVEKPFSDDRILDCVARALARKPAPGAAADPAAAERLGRLSQREREVLEQLVIGHPNKVIAHNLSISPRTVEIHRARVMAKMEARSLSELVRIAIASGVSGARA